MLIAVTSDVTAGAFLPPIVNAFQACDVEVRVAAAPGPGLDRLHLATGVTTAPIGWAREPSALADLSAAWAFRRLLRNYEPDIVVTATPKASLIATLAARLHGVPLVVHLAWGLRSETLRGFRRLVVRLLEGSGTRAAHWVLPNSHSLASRLIGLHLAVPDRTRVLGAGSSHGVEVSQFSIARNERVTQAVVIGFVGRIVPDKGVRELLTAFQRLRRRGLDVELVLAGTVEDEKLGRELQDARDQCNRIRLLSHTDNVATVYAQLDIFCLPSYREGFPNVCLEAAAAGLPVVVAKATGSVDAVIDGWTGMIVPCRDERALADALQRFVSDPVERRTFGLRGRQWVEDHFDSGTVASSYAEFILSQVAS